MVDPDAVDAHQFIQLVLRAQNCTDPVQRAKLLDRALSLWRGPALGSHNELVAELAELTRFYPTSQRLIAARMLELHRAGRQTDALAVFRQAAAAPSQPAQLPGDLATFTGRAELDSLLAQRPNDKDRATAIVISSIDGMAASVRPPSP